MANNKKQTVKKEKDPQDGTFHLSKKRPYTEKEWLALSDGERWLVLGRAAGLVTPA